MPHCDAGTDGPIQSIIRGGNLWQIHTVPLGLYHQSCMALYSFFSASSFNLPQKLPVKVIQRMQQIVVNKIKIQQRAVHFHLYAVAWTDSSSLTKTRAHDKHPLSLLPKEILCELFSKLSSLDSTIVRSWKLAQWNYFLWMHFVSPISPELTAAQFTLSFRTIFESYNRFVQYSNYEMRSIPPSTRPSAAVRGLAFQAK